VREVDLEPVVPEVGYSPYIHSAYNYVIRYRNNLLGLRHRNGHMRAELYLRANVIRLERSVASVFSGKLGHVKKGSEDSHGHGGECNNRGRPIGLLYHSCTIRFVYDESRVILLVAAGGRRTRPPAKPTTPWLFECKCEDEITSRSVARVSLQLY